MASTIGIKVANGEFYPIMEENSQVKKRLVLTTAHDNQKSIQIDLYNSYAKTMADALYVGSLVVENLKPQPKGEANIQMILSSNSAGQIAADAVDLDDTVNGTPQHLSVSLTDVEEDDRENDAIPDFDLEPRQLLPRDLYDKDSAPGRSSQKKRFPWVLLIIAAVLLLAIGGFLCLFFFNSRFQTLIPWLPRPAATAPAVPAIPPVDHEIPLLPRSQTSAAAIPPAQETPASPLSQAPAAAIPPAQETPALPRSQAPAAAIPPAQETPAQPRSQAPAAAIPPAQETPASPRSQTPAPAPVISSALQPPVSAAAGEGRLDRTRTSAPVASYRVPQTIPREGVPYRIRWGDTLWDISEAFYRNPWLYQRIARFNAIRNPDFIISGNTIRIPPRD